MKLKGKFGSSRYLIYVKYYYYYIPNVFHEKISICRHWKRNMSKKPTKYTSICPPSKWHHCQTRASYSWINQNAEWEILDQVDDAQYTWFTASVSYLVLPRFNSLESNY